MTDKHNRSTDSHIDINFYKNIGKIVAGLAALLILALVFFLYLGLNKNLNSSNKSSLPGPSELVLEEDDFDKVENGIHVMTGLAYDENFNVVRSSCTSCHSAKIIIQNRFTKDGWLEIIRWMQETQGLTDLGDREPQILDYLAKHYAPKELGRRPNLDMASIEWYTLSLD